MSPAAEPLRDEVCCQERRAIEYFTNIVQGTRSQVVVAGAIAGLVSRFCIAPLDVLKIRLQLQYHSLADPLATNTPFRKPLGVLQVARDILYHEGITGFWKGNIPAEGLYLSYGAAQFLAYRSATQAIDALNTNVFVPRRTLDLQSLPYSVQWEDHAFRQHTGCDASHGIS